MSIADSGAVVVVAAAVCWHWRGGLSCLAVVVVVAGATPRSTAMSDTEFPRLASIFEAGAILVTDNGHHDPHNWSWPPCWSFVNHCADRSSWARPMHCSRKTRQTPTRSTALTFAVFSYFAWNSRHLHELVRRVFVRVA